MPGADGQDEARAKLERKHARLIKRAFDQVLAAVVPEGTTEETINPETAVWRYREAAGVIRDALVEMLMEAAMLGAETGLAQVEWVLGVGQPRVNQAVVSGADWDLVNQEVLDWVLGGQGRFGEGYGNGLAAQITRTSETQIRASVAEWIRNGLPLRNLVRTLEGTALSRRRAEMIATTEVTRAYAEGNRRAWRMSGVIPQMEWQTAADELVCPICQPLRGVVVGIDENFPGGLEGPPAHVRCRCWVVPVVEDAPGVVDVPAAQRPPVPALQPAGTPVSSALRLPSRGRLAKPLREAADAIDSVHGDGPLPVIPVEGMNSMLSAGQYARKLDGTPVHIRVNRDGPHPRITLAHEVGHFLDHTELKVSEQLQQHGWLRPDIAPTNAREGLTPEVAQWRDAVNQSQAVQRLVRLAGGEKMTVVLDGQSFDVRADDRYVRYLLGYNEIWARSYSQYIAERSGNAEMAAELAGMFRPNDYPAQWEASDFEPIARAIDGLLAAKGWRR